MFSILSMVLNNQKLMLYSLFCFFWVTVSNTLNWIMTPKPVTWYLKIWYIEFATFFSRRTRIRVTKWDTYEKMIIYWKYRWGKTLISLALKFFAHKVICNYIPEQGTYFVCLNVALPNLVLVLLLPLHSDSCSHSPHSTHSVWGTKCVGLKPTTTYEKRKRNMFEINSD